MGARGLLDAAPHNTAGQLHDWVATIVGKNPCGAAVASLDFEAGA
jgi:hypothetical protein